MNELSLLPAPVHSCPSRNPRICVFLWSTGHVHGPGVIVTTLGGPRSHRVLQAHVTAALPRCTPPRSVLFFSAGPTAQGRPRHPIVMHPSDDTSLKHSQIPDFSQDISSTNVVYSVLETITKLNPRVGPTSGLPAGFCCCFESLRGQLVWLVRPVLARPPPHNPTT